MSVEDWKADPKNFLHKFVLIAFMKTNLCGRAGSDHFFGNGGQAYIFFANNKPPDCIFRNNNCAYRLYPERVTQVILSFFAAQQNSES